MTLNQLYDRYMEQKYDIKSSTRATYMYMYNRFVRDDFGKHKISKIKYTDIKKFYYSLILDKALKSNTINGIHAQLHPAFQMAVRDGLLRINPTDGIMSEIKKSHMSEEHKRHALTIPQQTAFMNYIKSHRKYIGWLPIITVLLGTGMRIGECLGLRWNDLDFENRIISINHNFVNHPNGEGSCIKKINTPKTESGIRTIPMIDEVYEAFLQEYEMQKCVGFCSEVIDGYTNFVFVTANGTIYAKSSVNKVICQITDEYNAEEKVNAEQENREPLIIPHFSVHNLRHTFCTRVCENETNIKVIQSLMGHSSIETTMNIYAEATNEKKQEVMANLNGKIIL
jgi:integrase